MDQRHDRSDKRMRSQGNNSRGNTNGTTMLQVHAFTFNAFQEHTYVVYDDTRDCAIIDPGCYTPQEQAVLSAFIEQHGLRVQHLINTHAHIDHVLGNQYVKVTYGVKLALHALDLPTLRLATQYADRYGFPDYQPTKADLKLEAGDTIQVGHNRPTVLHVPGHAPGHIALYSAQDKLCLAGDVLFKNSIGRTDLPGGDHALLLHSIHQQLFPFWYEVIIYPGHGPSTTIGVEKSCNPHCRL